MANVQTALRRETPRSEARMQETAILRGRSVAIAAGVITAFTTVLYLVVISSEDDNRVAGVAFVVLLLVTALAGIVGAIALDGVGARGIAGSVAAGLLVSLGMLAIFTIGVPLLAAGILMIVWLARTSVERSGTNPAAPVVAFIAGFVLPLSLIVLH